MGGVVTAIVECDGRMCCGSRDGSIQVWSRASREYEWTLEADEDDSESPVNALAVWEGRLISGHGCGKLLVWNVATGECCQVLEGHCAAVRALAVCRSRLSSGAEDGSIRLWAVAAGAAWACERELLGQTGAVWSLAGWRDKVASGSSDGSIRVWDAGTGALDADGSQPIGHWTGVRALVVHWDRLLSASDDGMIRVWALGTSLIQQEACIRGTGAEVPPYRLAMSGSKFVSGSAGLAQAEALLWGLAELEIQKKIRDPMRQPADVRNTAVDWDDWEGVAEGNEERPLQPEQTMRQPADVNALVEVDGEVWEGVGNEVVVWGLTRKRLRQAVRL
jgi:WD40 repeat protein